MFINIGFGNFINSKQIISISRSDSAPMKRMVQIAKENNNVIDATQGRKTKTIIVMTSSHVILSALLPETIASRCEGKHIYTEEIRKEEDENE